MQHPDLEQTLVLIKPDALKFSLTGYVLSQFSEFHTGLRFAGAKIVHVTGCWPRSTMPSTAGSFFYPSLIEYIMGKIHYPGDAAAAAGDRHRLPGPDAVKKVREMAGPTNPHVAREQGAGDRSAARHGRTGQDEAGGDRQRADGQPGPRLRYRGEAEREIKLWFQPTDIMPYHAGLPHAAYRCPLLLPGRSSIDDLHAGQPLPDRAGRRGMGERSTGVRAASWTASRPPSRCRQWRLSTC